MTPDDEDVRLAIAELTDKEYELGMTLYSVERTGDYRKTPPLAGKLGLPPIYAVLARNLLRNEGNRQCILDLLHAGGPQ